MLAAVTLLIPVLVVPRILRLGVAREVLGGRGECSGLVFRHLLLLEELFKVGDPIDEQVVLLMEVAHALLIRSQLAFGLL